MKILLVLALSLFSSAAYAENFQCSAQGYDRNNSVQIVRGRFFPKEYDARQSAVQTCRIRGLTGCYVTLCYRFN